MMVDDRWTVAGLRDKPVAAATRSVGRMTRLEMTLAATACHAPDMRRRYGQPSGFLHNEPPAAQKDSCP